MVSYKRRGLLDLLNLKLLRHRQLCCERTETPAVMERWPGRSGQADRLWTTCSVLSSIMIFYDIEKDFFSPPFSSARRCTAGTWASYIIGECCASELQPQPCCCWFPQEKAHMVDIRAQPARVDFSLPPDSYFYIYIKVVWLIYSKVLRKFHYF